MPDINNISQVNKMPENFMGKASLNLDLLDEFNSVFKEATAAMANVDNELEKKRTKQINDERNVSLESIDNIYLAQVNNGVVANAQNAKPDNLNIVPLQIFLDNAIKSLERVSKQEFRVNNLMDQFVG